MRMEHNRFSPLAVVPRYSTRHNHLMGHSYVTTHTLDPQQSLKLRGTLQLNIQLGFIRRVKQTSDSRHYISLFNVFLPRARQLLDLRDIEQDLGICCACRAVLNDESIIDRRWSPFGT